MNKIFLNLAIVGIAIIAFFGMIVAEKMGEHKTRIVINSKDTITPVTFGELMLEDSILKDQRGKVLISGCKEFKVLE